MRGEKGKGREGEEGAKHSARVIPELVPRNGPNEPVIVSKPTFHFGEKQRLPFQKKNRLGTMKRAKAPAAFVVAIVSTSSCQPASSSIYYVPVASAVAVVHTLKGRFDEAEIAANFGLRKRSLG